jgi:heat shock protein HspQ
MTFTNSHPLFFIGQLVHHKKFDYRGVIIDVDAEFSGTEEWYQQVALSRPPKDKPWYHVLVDNSNQLTYVAELHLEQDSSTSPVNHPAIDMYFEDFEDGVYTPSTMKQ